MLVCTIDPSRRLATSLGLRAARRTSRGALDLGSVALPSAAGDVWAMTLDTKRTFDALVERHTPADGGAPARILENRFYQQVSAALAGSHEYMAMEKLLELSADERFDLVVLDTPPTRHALDFLEAPDRLMGFLDTSVLRWFLKPYFVAGRLTLKVATRTGALALKLADRVPRPAVPAGPVRVLPGLRGHVRRVQGARGAACSALLRDPHAGFVLVASPARARASTRRSTSTAAARERDAVRGLRREPGAPRPPRGARRAGRPRPPGVDDDLAGALVEVYPATSSAWRAHERRALGRLEADTGEAPILVPELEADVHDLRGLKEVGDVDAGSASRRAARRGRARAASGTGEPMRIILYSGKGGVGKTSLSAATAVRAGGAGPPHARRLHRRRAQPGRRARASQVERRAHARRAEPRRARDRRQPRAGRATGA